MSVSVDPTPRRILIRGVNWLGDAVMTTPALLRLREKFSNAHVAILTPEKLADLWQHHPAIDEIISFSKNETVFAVARKIRRWGERPREPISERRLNPAAARGDARPTRFDLALVLPNSPRSALEVFFAHIPQRIGYARAWRNFFLTQNVPPRAEAVKMRKRSVDEIKKLIAKNPESRIQNPEIPKSAHQVFEYLDLVSALGANPEPLPPQLFVAPDEIAVAKAKFGLDKFENPFFGLNPCAEYGPAKRWPVEKFTAAAKEIQQKTNCVWLLFGGKNDLPLATQIESAIGNRQSAMLNLAGKTSLRELMSLLKLCRVLLTNDTGPMHVAAALGTPVVAPFGSTSPELTGPIFSANAKILKSTAPCSPCFLRECPIDFRCLNEIGVERVVDAVFSVVH